MTDGTKLSSAPSAVLIAGPTASGKSSLAVRLAEMVDGVIINADSMQIYDEMLILSARPTADEMGGIEHRLYGYVPPSERYSVGRWLDDAVAAIKDVRASGRCPILVGGTGLYYKALLEGLNAIPEVSDAVRAHWAGELHRLGSPEALHAILSDRDPAMAATLKAADGQRILRALEILDETGKSLLDWQAEDAMRHDTSIVEDSMRMVLLPPRELVYGKIEKRFDQMVELGGIEEARHLASLGIDPDLPAMKAIGVAHLNAFADGRISYDEAIALCKRDTRRYAKRQMTWIRNQMDKWPHFETAEAAIAHFLIELKSKGEERV
ncbi:tRNA (adenosine(37)-N6)-dimethylallyltransferase MiaA [Cohaesibacter sp. CAU 1516]|uniref:tRNA (adenosine(37)-N6)-dimethylallyltransferase MiaA n=1 Tax=Cohaesibacter sp. CAU 1516 TaxID=2576038 RepID=UPI0010FF2686|nr:tRNA (adenosine(37)-N6)-dimethylallyltransferase MiaA [Cohaesibacter sp. CAU 1516]TLP48471.1 tRNA (adenosine(37)-N6)-dimethylallyltransferase MiaA [Cohaesibacter sp. CAU 1516]